MTDLLVDVQLADVVEIHEPASVLIDVLGTNRVAVVETIQLGAILDITDPTTTGVLTVVTPGPPGPQGDTGEQGPQGDTGPSPMYDQVFAAPEMIWTVVHPLNTKPVVTTVDQNGDEIIGDVSFPDNSTVIITFGLPFAGTARLKAKGANMPNFGSAVQFNRIPGLQFVAEKSSTPPTSPVSGQLWTDTSVTPHKLRWYDGTVWVAADYTSLADGYITNSHVAGNANISLSKLAVDVLARENHTGTQTAATISDFNTAVRTNRLDQLAAPTSALDVNGQRINNVAAPTLGTDAANKSYVDNSRAGISVKDPVRVAVTDNININAPGAALDGVPLDNGDRFLAAGQSTGTQNGLYTYNGPSTPATRAPDADSAGEVFDGSMVAVAEGAHAGYQFIQTDTASGAPGTWTQQWIVFITGGQTYIAGNGLQISGTTFSIAGPVSIANGGTGATTAAEARDNLGTLARYAANNVAWTAGVTYTITHNLGSSDVAVAFRTLGDGRSIDLDWIVASDDTITVRPDLSFGSGTVRIVVIG